MRLSLDEANAKMFSGGNYCDEDASTLLKGNSGALDQILLRELHLDGDSIKIPPFYMFQYINKSLILDMVHAEHERLKSFIIQVDIEPIRAAIL